LDVGGNENYLQLPLLRRSCSLPGMLAAPGQAAYFCALPTGV